MEPRPPIHLLAGPDPDTTTALFAKRRQLLLAELPQTPFDLSRHGLVVEDRVRDQRDAEALLLAVARGVPAVIELACSEDLERSLVDELGRVGEVTDGRRPRDPLAGLSGEQRAILRGLAQGGSLVDIAEQLAMSRRTATRRLQEAKDALAVSTTVEAMLLVRHLLLDDL